MRAIHSTFNAISRMSERLNGVTWGMQILLFYTVFQGSTPSAQGLVLTLALPATSSCSCTKLAVTYSTLMEHSCQIGGFRLPLLGMNG